MFRDAWSSSRLRPFSFQAFACRPFQACLAWRRLSSRLAAPWRERERQEATQKLRSSAASKISPRQFFSNVEGVGFSMPSVFSVLKPLLLARKGLHHRGHRGHRGMLREKDRKAKCEGLWGGGVHPEKHALLYLLARRKKAVGRNRNAEFPLPPKLN